MRSFIERLRQKPDKVKKKIALGTSAAVTSLIFVGWVTVLSYGVVTPGAGGQELESGATQTASPLTAFGDNASAAFSELKSSFASTASSSQPATDDAATEGAEEGVEGVVEGRSTTTADEPTEKSSTNSAADATPASEDSYWNVQNVLSETENQQEGSASANASNTPSVQEHFNSRNYNPVQTSGWISQ